MSEQSVTRRYNFTMSFFYFANQSDSWIFESKYNATPLKEVSNTSKDSISTKMTRMPTTPFDSLDPSGIVMLHFASAMKVWRKVSFFSFIKIERTTMPKGWRYKFSVLFFWFHKNSGMEGHRLARAVRQQIQAIGVVDEWLQIIDYVLIDNKPAKHRTCALQKLFLYH